MEAAGRSPQFEGKRAEIAGDPIRSCAQKLRIGGSGTQRQYARTGCFTRANTGGGIFNDNAIRGRYSEKLRAFPVGIREWFAALDIVGGDERRGDRQSRRSQAHFGQAASCGSDDGPSLRGYGLQEVQGARKSCYIGDVFDFEALDFTIFSVVIAARQQFADGGEAGAAMGLTNYILGHQAMTEGPNGPYARDGGGGIDEDAVHVEENRAALNHGGRQNALARRKIPSVEPLRLAKFGKTRKDWGGRRGSNPRHSVPQTDALPAELLPPPVDGT